MLNSLRVRMVLILTILTTSVMLIVGTFFLNSISAFYHDDFKKQMSQVFSNAEFLASAQTAMEGENQAVEIYELLRAYSGQLGVDSYRDFYILDGDSGAYILGTNADEGMLLERTTNLIAAVAGKAGDKISRTAGYLDYAINIEGGESSFVIYIKDTKNELKEMIWMLFAIIVQALFVGLIIAISMSFFLSKAITNPIENITKGAKLLASGEFSYKLPVVSKDEIGTLTQTFNQMADVIKNTMAQIEGERGKLETIFLYLTDGVVAFSKNGDLIHKNKSGIEMLGIDEGHQTFDDIFAHCKIDVKIEDILSLARGENLIKQNEINGQVIRICFAHFDVENEDHEIGGGVIGVLQDITEQQEFENSRREFVANVSHELRTPLTSVKSYTETVLSTPDLDKQTTSKFLNVVLYETDRMTRLVKDLLVLSRLDSKKMDWVFTTFSLNNLLSNIYDSTLMDARNHSHILMLSVPTDVVLMYGDKDRIEQVIINVVTNAIKYTPDGGKINITVGQEGDFATVTVSDNGVGIPKEDIPRLFERFYRVDKARSRQKGGTGLGLAIAKEIIYAHNGKIIVDSVVEKGTSIKILLPIKMEER